MNITDYFNEKDIKQIEEMGLSVSDVEKQIKRFSKGFPYLNVVKAASLKDGILSLDKEKLNKYLEIWEQIQRHDDTQILKFVPASGAASRMFKDLYEFLNSEEEYTEDTLPESIKLFFSNISDFAFYNALDETCLSSDWRTVSCMLAQNDYKGVVRNLLDEKGLAYGHLPKALLLFHRYKDANRTAAEEHLAEGALYAKDGKGEVNLHFTLSPEHIQPFNKLMAAKKKDLEDRYSVRFNISHSVQKKETDTIAVDLQNRPLRDGETGNLVFRPGGHGALIQNLNDIDADVIFIKNIDNVVPDHHKCETIIYKKALAGYLIYLRDKIYKIMDQISRGKYSKELLENAVDLLRRHFSVKVNVEDLPLEESISIVREKLNRPIRVCGMVRNEGEPGGGPYIVEDEDGTTSLQILESTQIDKNNDEAMSILRSGTHFNPVDLVCCVKDFKGHKFDLTAFIDEDTGFISEKSKNGVELKALELPGLWNGAMSGWNTAFVEVPVETFNPVKVVTDLLRDMHQ